MKKKKAEKAKKKAAAAKQLEREEAAAAQKLQRQQQSQKNMAQWMVDKISAAVPPLVAAFAAPEIGLIPPAVVQPLKDEYASLKQELQWCTEVLSDDFTHAAELPSPAAVKARAKSVAKALALVQQLIKAVRTTSAASVAALQR